MNEEKESMPGFPGRFLFLFKAGGGLLVFDAAEAVRL